MTDKVVLIHGLWMHGTVMSLLARRLGQAGFDVDSFSYPTIRAGLRANTQRLHAFVETLAARRIHLVGHSLGGVLAMHLLEAFPPGRIARVVCLGSPLTDSVAFRKISRRDWGRKIAGRTLGDAMRERRLERSREDMEVGSIAGRIPLGIGFVAGDLPGPHDGVVTVAETQLPGIRHRITLPVTHSGMLVSRAVADQTAHFLREGRFDQR